MQNTQSTNDVSNIENTNNINNEKQAPSIIKRVLALLTVIIIVSLYIITFVLAITGSEQTLNMVFASFAASCIFPFFLWLIARMIEYRNNRKM